MAEPPAVMRHQFVQRINHWRQPKRFEQATQEPQPRQFGQQRRSPARIARKRRAVAQNYPPR